MHVVILVFLTLISTQRGGEVGNEREPKGHSCFIHIKWHFEIGNSALHLAATANRAAVVAQLLRAGTDPMQKDAMGKVCSILIAVYI